MRSREPKIRRLGEIYNRRNLIKKYSGISEVKELDAETGLYYYGARYLDPRTSRWLSGDPAIYEGDYLPGPGRDPSKLGGMGGVYNIINLHAYHYGANNPIKYVDPDGRCGEIATTTSWTVSDQLSFLMNHVNNTNGMHHSERAELAESLRSTIRTTLFDLDGLITGPSGNEQFMNETLRDFLNTSDSGLPYTYPDMIEANGWRRSSFFGSLEHQNDGSILYPNRKYTNSDGREAIFTTIDGVNWVLSNNPRDKGTYNYARDVSEWGYSTEHGRWDMNPYFRQFGHTPWYRELERQGPYRREDYNRNGRANGTGHFDF